MKYYNLKESDSNHNSFAVIKGENLEAVKTALTEHFDADVDILGKVVFATESSFVICVDNEYNTVIELEETWLYAE